MPSIVPATDKGSEWPQYFVLCDYGSKLGFAWSEVDPAKADRETILKWLIHGEFTNPVQIMEVNLPAGTSRDVTAEFMAQVEDRAAA